MQLNGQALNYSTRFLEWYRENAHALKGLRRCTTVLHATALWFLEQAVVFQLPMNGRTIQGGTYMPSTWADYLKLPYPITAFEFPCVGGPVGDCQTLISNRRISLCVDLAHMAQIAAHFAPKACKGEEERTGFAQFTIYSVDALTAHGEREYGGQAIKPGWQVAPLMNIVGTHTVTKLSDRLIDDMRAHAAYLVTHGQCSEGYAEETEKTIRDATNAGEMLGIQGVPCPGFEDLSPELLRNETSDELLAAVQACVTLACANIKARRVEPSVALNEKRQESGKVPLRAFHMLTIDGEPIDKGESKGGTHASPRRHFRRAHIRRLESGRMTWVRHAIVNSTHSNSLDKAYILKSTSGI